MLEVNNVSKKGLGSFQLKGIQFTQATGQRIALIGETGSGKSTLLKIIAGLEDADDGIVKLNEEIVKGPAQLLVAGHPQIAYLPQYFELPKFLRVEQVLEYANHLSKNQAQNLFRYCRIHHLLQRKTNELSGGERQRIALCRLLIAKPTLILLDEPFSNLDRIMKQTLKEVLAEIEQNLSITTILVSHDPSDTLPWADWMMVLKHGKVVQKGLPFEIYKKPKTEYVAALLGDYSVHGKSKTVTRPEEWKIKKDKNGKGTVMNISWMGSYALVSVKKGDDVVLVYTQLVNLNIGDKVKVEPKN